MFSMEEDIQVGDDPSFYPYRPKRNLVSSMEPARLQNWNLQILNNVMSSKTAKELWDSLEQRFGKSNGSKLYHLQKELTSLIQENSDIAGYFTKLKRLWNELDGINDENQREVYANTNYISDSGLFLAASQAKQQDNKLIAEFAAFMANGQGRNTQRFKHQAIRGTNTYQKYTNPGQNQRHDKPQNKFKDKKKYDPNLSCTYCGKTRHVHDDCYRLHRFPADFEFTNSRNHQPQIKANATLTQQADEDIGRTDPGIRDRNFEEQFSKHQIAEMMQMYKQSKLTQTRINANAVVGTILKYSNSVPTNLKQNTWIIDSGASEHMCFDPNSFLFLKPLPMPLNINLPNSFKVSVTHIGSISILPGQVITDVLLVPDFKYNLLSIYKFYVQFQYDVLFTATGCFLQDLSVRSPQVFGEVREGLYLLDSNTDKFRNSFNSNDVSSDPIPQSLSVFYSVHVNATPSVKLWHVRFFLTIVDDYSRGNGHSY
ncbi:uncharacterized protein LOC129875577 [Solanum dulcamara]|uniref:uncharacterized protein LOC129875577 n=1 Tax=Solanum dulcamara TaxID=45834 RepID=UPI002486541D|nr:uncharacterized protein LOC129875577 [Solanum dulcamara]